jgi:hypothetical protein
MKQLFIASVVLLASWCGVTQATSNLPISGATGVVAKSFAWRFWNMLAPNANQVSFAAARPPAFFSVSQTLQDSVSGLLRKN